MYVYHTRILPYFKKHFPRNQENDFEKANSRSNMQNNI